MLRVNEEVNDGAQPVPNLTSDIVAEQDVELRDALARKS